MKRIMLGFCTFFLLHAAGSLALSRQLAPASLQGVVIQTANNEPLGNTTVELRNAAGTAMVDSITTAADGVFVFPEVRPGQYRLSASHAGYIKSEYGQRQPGGPTLLLTLAPGQRESAARLFISPGGVISGRVTERGQAVGIADVFAIRVAYYEGMVVPTPVLSTKTNDLGEFRIFWLPPGRYYIATMINDQASNSPLFLNPEGDNSILFQTRFPMRAVLNRAIGAGAAENEMHVPTFYPGTVDPELAIQIDLKPGGEVRNIDISSPALPIRHVRGNVVGAIGPNGQPMRAEVRLAPANIATALGSATIGQPGAQAELNGTFDIQRVYQGSYSLIATAGSRTSSVPVEVRGSDANGVVVTLGAGITLNGRIVVERSGPAPAGTDPVATALNVTLNSEPNNPGSPSYNSGNLGNGMFRIPGGGNTAGMLAGNYRVVVTPLLTPRSEPGRPPRVLPAPLQNAYVKSIRLGDRDVMNDGLPLQSNPQELLEIVIGASPGTLEGRVLNDRKQPAGAVWVALIPETKLRYRFDHKYTSTDVEGRFQIANVPPGDYKVFALESIEKLGWQEPDLMREYEASGLPLRIEEGKTTSVEVTSIP